VADLTLPFVARGETGQAQINYAQHGDPDRWGIDILGLEGDVSRAAAFPVFEASISYPRDGYAAFFGWIQVVHYWSGSADRPAWSLLDNPPQLRGLGVPFFSYGLLPRFFDAPLDTPADISRWQALTFLTQTPDGLMSRNSVPLLGVSWGYLIDDEIPTMLPVVRATPQEWVDVREFLQHECPTWTFGGEHLLGE
jgi:hypothetical protein